MTLPGLDWTSDPVKLYLREMGAVSLLTRNGELAIAREIERGEKSIIKAISKTRLVLKEVLSLADKIEADSLIVPEMFEVSEDDVAEGKHDRDRVLLDVAVAAGNGARVIGADDRVGPGRAIGLVNDDREAGRGRRPVAEIPLDVGGERSDGGVQLEQDRLIDVGHRRGVRDRRGERGGGSQREEEPAGGTSGDSSQPGRRT